MAPTKRGDDEGVLPLKADTRTSGANSILMGGLKVVLGFRHRVDRCSHGDLMQRARSCCENLACCDICQTRSGREEVAINPVLRLSTSQAADLPVTLHLVAADEQ